MKVSVTAVAGISSAVLGVGLSHGLIDPFGPLSPTTAQKVIEIAKGLSSKDGGHNKFLEAINIYCVVQAPRYWWQEFDTYRVGITKQSESTMHTITKRQLTQDDFEEPICFTNLEWLNHLITQYQIEVNKQQKHKVFKLIKNNLSEGFLQTRTVVLNVKTFMNMLSQRKKHKLDEWRVFLYTVYLSLWDHNVPLQWPEPAILEGYLDWLEEHDMYEK